MKTAKKPRPRIRSCFAHSWDEWFAAAKPTITLRRGEHYHCGQGSFAQQIRTAASLRGLHVSLFEVGESFLVTVNGVK